MKKFYMAKMPRYFYLLYKILLIIILGFITGIFLISKLQPPTKKHIVTGPISCYHILDDSVLDIWDIRPLRGKSIFFHETSCKSHMKGKLIISSRQACAVESAARMNPNHDVYLLFASPGQIKDENTTSDRFLRALLTYKSVKIHRLNYGRYVKNTPLEDLYESGKLESSKYSLSHASDILRYLTLWKYGGIYLDLDVIVVKSLNSLSANYAGSESKENVAAGVLNFDPFGDGHHFAELCVKDLKYHFSGTEWGHNGPGVITSNVKIHYLNYENYLNNTPLEKLYKLVSSVHPFSHAKDILRYLSLWKYGGVYLDLDVILLKSLENLPPNYAGFDLEDIAVGILSFAATGDGHYFSELCVEDLKSNFNGNIWRRNGPSIIARLLQRICKAKTAKEMQNKNCSGFTVYPPEAFYPIPWRQWKTYFDPKMNDKIWNITKNSYVVHIWNRFSENRKISLDQDVPYSILARKHCPKVFAECEDFF